MSVYGLYVISESGSLQFYYDHSDVNVEVEKKYDFPLPFHFKAVDGRIVVDFGACDDVKIGYTVISVDGITAKGTSLEDNRDILKVFSDKDNFPLTIKLGRPRLRPNDRIHLASMFHPLHSMARLLSPIPDSSFSFVSPANDKKAPRVWNSGIQTLETECCRVHCFETHTGVKFLLVTDVKLPMASREALRRVYEAYTDFVLKNPFYARNQPFNYEFFANQIKTICDQVEKGMYVIN
ncbi:synbindin, putative [Schistosoma mansoni]|uniref:Trafficking protein particle complex subunit n=1 Tax=Schistosoma mansoni TaxID=6183 RepID=G4M0U2_SCHMA|nr:synbindin, putative [Schistosoma mansoni]|eukprot:XP_018647107.1 synbindin, putative [Schistosoma mansoni]